MDAETLKILRDHPAIDNIAEILIKSLHRATVETQHGTVEISVPVHAGKFRPPKEVIVIAHN